MLGKLAIWYLRMRKRSVLIGYELNKDYIRSLGNFSYIYNNEVKGLEYRDVDGEVFEIPEGKFKISRDLKGENN